MASELNSEEEWIVVPVFGGDDLQLWLNEMEKIMRQFEVPKLQMVNFAHVYVEGPARTWVGLNYDEICEMNWLQFVDAIQEEFDQNPETLKKALGIVKEEIPVSLTGSDVSLIDDTKTEMMLLDSVEIESIQVQEIKVCFEEMVTHKIESRYPPSVVNSHDMSSYELSSGVSKSSDVSEASRAKFFVKQKYSSTNNRNILGIITTAENKYDRGPFLHIPYGLHKSAIDVSQLPNCDTHSALQELGVIRYYSELVQFPARLGGFAKLLQFRTASPTKKGVSGNIITKFHGSTPCKWMSSTRNLRYLWCFDPGIMWCSLTRKGCCSVGVFMVMYDKLIGKVRVNKHTVSAPHSSNSPKRIVAEAEPALSFTKFPCGFDVIHPVHSKYLLTLETKQSFGFSESYPHGVTSPMSFDPGIIGCSLVQALTSALFTCAQYFLSISSSFVSDCDVDRATGFIRFAPVRCADLWVCYIGMYRRYKKKITFKCHTICVVDRVGLIYSLLPGLSGLRNCVLSHVLGVSYDSVEISKCITKWCIKKYQKMYPTALQAASHTVLSKSIDTAFIMFGCHMSVRVIHLLPGVVSSLNLWAAIDCYIPIHFHTTGPSLRTLLTACYVYVCLLMYSCFLATRNLVLAFGKQRAIGGKLESQFRYQAPLPRATSNSSVTYCQQFKNYLCFPCVSVKIVIAAWCPYGRTCCDLGIQVYDQVWDTITVYCQFLDNIGCVTKSLYQLIVDRMGFINMPQDLCDMYDGTYGEPTTGMHGESAHSHMLRLCSCVSNSAPARHNKEADAIPKVVSRSAAIIQLMICRNTSMIACEGGFVEENDNPPPPRSANWEPKRRRFPAAAMYMLGSRLKFDLNTAAANNTGLRRSRRNDGVRSPFNPVTVLRGPTDGINGAIESEGGGGNGRERGSFELYYDDGAGSGLRPLPASMSDFLRGSASLPIIFWFGALLKKVGIRHIILVPCATPCVKGSQLLTVDIGQASSFLLYFFYIFSQAKRISPAVNYLSVFLCSISRNSEVFLPLECILGEIEVSTRGRSVWASLRTITSLKIALRFILCFDFGSTYPTVGQAVAEELILSSPYVPWMLCMRSIAEVHMDVELAVMPINLFDLSYLRGGSSLVDSEYSATSQCLDQYVSPSKKVAPCVIILLYMELFSMCAIGQLKKNGLRGMALILLGCSHSENENPSTHIPDPCKICISCIQSVLIDATNAVSVPDNDILRKVLTTVEGTLFHRTLLEGLAWVINVTRILVGLRWFVSEAGCDTKFLCALLTDNSGTLAG